MALGTWNKEVFGDIHKKKRLLVARIEGVQKAFDLNYCTGLIKLDIKLKKELEEVLVQEEMFWFQKSQEEWIQSGDRNKKYYHASTMVRRARNRIGSL